MSRPTSSSVGDVPENGTSTEGGRSVGEESDRTRTNGKGTPTLVTLLG